MNARKQGMREADPMSAEWSTAYWRDLLDTEACNPVPPDHSRTFRPVYMARPVSLWPVILAVVGTIICAAVLVWFAVDSMSIHP